MFSDAISSMWSRRRPSSPRIAAASSGSASARRAPKNMSDNEGAIFCCASPIAPCLKKRTSFASELRDAALVPAALERSREERARRFLGDIFADEPGAKREHVGIVVLARQARRDCVVRDGGADRRVAVRGHAHADAAAAHQHAPFCL